MKLSRAHWILAAVNALYIGGFAIYYLSIRDFEFLWYVAVLLFFFALIFLTIDRTHFSVGVLTALSIWAFLHMAGGGIPAGDEVLYGMTLIPLHVDGEFTILKYDQFVHAYGFGVTTFVLHRLFRPFWHGSVGMLVIAAALGAMGLSVLNEIVEFIAVISLPQTGVGGYYNTGLDLVFNTLGAGAVGLWLYLRQRPQQSVEAGDGV